ncbi:helix-turn-helix domain-containing protein [Escherichia marmotae]|uniref:helix-turn-helix domain-containing protein n=1 Tax=unclassified Escherichia TaxID=2608889 RepID=UPI000988BAB8|nr:MULTISPECIES: helix-turn-helix domain-containing protein [Escherichia]MDZ5520554.1 helix-turn-helix domain-containing protein [Escherichia marmotae]MEC9604795.1 helix-turn-helix domain-containing protein [Escherichia marmotae]MEC9799370.1 helix-turn-helix domain-containing protein [Escherichia marmotae]MED0193358.1 helix-turn-helix domain-containing protein [Escherichia marmotae]MED0632874.1 helix-turn-helix domain-containing protein [Escherichia marmotae]
MDADVKRYSHQNVGAAGALLTDEPCQCGTALRIIFLRQRRLIRVQDYLQNSAFNIDKIAELTGFSHSALLRHHFHQRFLLSPSQYRKNNRPPSH